MIVVVKPAPKRPGRFEAWLQEGEPRLLCISQMPFFESARVLIAEGIDPGENVVAGHGDHGPEL